jgi:hypothetical protein
MRTSPTVPYPSEQIDSAVSLSAALQLLHRQDTGVVICDGGEAVAVMLTPSAFAALRKLVFDLELKADLLEARLDIANGDLFDQSEIEQMLDDRRARVVAG